MGSKSDWDTMRHACEMLDALGIAYEKRVVSAHRTPDLLVEYAKTAEERGLQVIIAGAGGAAHLPGGAAALSAAGYVAGAGGPEKWKDLWRLMGREDLIEDERYLGVGVSGDFYMNSFVPALEGWTLDLLMTT